jgi:outer membrane protein assembly factor BamB
MRILKGLVLVFLAGAGWSFSAVAGDVLTYHNNNARTGVNPDEIVLTPQNVRAVTFGLKFKLIVDGQLYAEPLYVSSQPIFDADQFLGRHNIVVVATEHDSVYAFDADSGKLYWQVSLIRAGEIASDSRNCPDLTPEVGITSTPVIDRGMGPYGTIYVVAMTRAAKTLTYFYRLYALDLSTGKEILAPATIQASFPDPGGHGPNYNRATGNIDLNPGYSRQRAALVLANGLIYTEWASFCGVGPSSGWIIAYDEKTLAQAHVLNVNPDGSPSPATTTGSSAASIWQAGSGALVDEQGNLFLATANGPFDTSFDQNGFPVTGDFGDTFLKLSPSLRITDFFTPSDQLQRVTSDDDLGSGGSILLPDLFDSNNQVHHLAVTAGKLPIMYLIDRDHLGRYNPSRDVIYQELPSALGGLGVWSAPAYFNGGLYFGPIGASMRRFKFDSNAKLDPVPDSLTNTIFAYPGTNPTISAFGNTHGIVWAAEHTSTTQGREVLHAYDALDLQTELYNSAESGTRDEFGLPSKFIVPTISNGKVYIGSTGLPDTIVNKNLSSGTVGVFGLFNPTPATDVSSTIQVSRGGFRYLPANGHFVQLVTLTNTGSTPIPLPVSLVLDNLNNGAALANANGATTLVSPLASQYVNAPLDNSLEPSESVTIQLDFIDTQKQPLLYTIRVLAGVNSR